MQHCEDLCLLCMHDVYYIGSVYVGNSGMPTQPMGTGSPNVHTFYDTYIYNCVFVHFRRGRGGGRGRGRGGRGTHHSPRGAHNHNTGAGSTANNNDQKKKGAPIGYNA